MFTPGLGLAESLGRAREADMAATALPRCDAWGAPAATDMETTGGERERKARPGLAWT